MQSKGADIDIVTGKPIALQKKESTLAREQAEEASLKNQAELAGIVQTEAGRILVEMISKKLQDRIEHVLGTDPEAIAYMKILQEMGNQDLLGRNAMKKLVAGRLGQAHS